MSDDLSQLRREIDGIDDEIARLLGARAEVVRRVGRVKQAEQIASYEPAREREILDRVARATKELPPAAVRRIFREILRHCLPLSENPDLPAEQIERSLCPPNIASLQPYVPGKPTQVLERELGVTGAVKLASNENPLGPAPKALEAVRAALDDAHLYPEGSSHYLREALAQRHGVTRDEVICGSGTYELLELVVRTFCTPEEEVLHAQPSFVCYHLAAAEHGVGEVTVPLTDGIAYDVERLLASVTSRTKVLFLANPNNPTGAYLAKEAFERLVFELPGHVILALDEAYFEYARAGDYPDSTRYRNARELLLSFRTFSKIYGLAGLRIGYALGSRELIDCMNRVRPPFNVTSLAQVAAQAALEDHEHVTRSREVNSQGLDYLTEELTRLGATVYPSQANFLFVDVGRESGPVYEALLARGVIVRPMGGPTHFRMSVGRPEENRRLVAALAEVLA